MLPDVQATGLNLAFAVQRGINTIHGSLVLTSVGHLSTRDSQQLDLALRQWLHL